MKFPVQPIEADDAGVFRFRANAIVRYLLDSGRIDLDQIAARHFPAADQEQFAQLIGTSLGSFGDLAYVSNETFAIAAKMAEGGKTEEQARIAYLEELLATRENRL